jgi:hypothetical protein
MSRIFNKRNKYGKHLVEAIIPGWGSGETGAATSGEIRSFGQRDVIYNAQNAGSPTASSINKKVASYQTGQPVTYLEITQQNQFVGRKYVKDVGDDGPPVGESWTVVAIVKLVGNGQPDGGDPRIWTKDEGSAEANHDLMIGLVSGTNIRPRMRVRLGTTTRTVLPTDDTEFAVVNDGWHLIAGSCRYISGSDGSLLDVMGVYPDGRFKKFGIGFQNGAYDPRTTTSEAMWGTAELNQNLYEGGILAVYFFRGLILDEKELRDLYANPWQVFKPKQILVPMTAAVITEEDLGPATVEGSISFGVTADKTPTVQLDAAATATFLVNLAFLPTIPSIDASISFDITADQLQTNTADRPVSFTASVNLDLLSTAQADLVRSTLFNVSVAQDQTNVKITNNIITFDTTLDLVLLNQLIAEANITFNTTAGLDLLNQLIAAANISFDTTAGLDLLNQLIARTNITFDTTVDFQFSADGAGIVNAAISFIATMNQIQTNTITIDKAFSLIVDLADQYNAQIDKPALISFLINAAQAQDAVRGVPGDVTFATTLDQSQTNILNKVIAITMAATLDQTLTTQLDYNLFVAFATTLAEQVSTDGEVLASVSFGVDVTQQEINTKDIPESIILALQTDMQTELHLIADGRITLSAQMSESSEIQLLAQAGITFGHIIGLASIGSADLGDSINFGTIQDFSINGFVAQFTITTPQNRILKVYIEDRTTIVDELERVITVGNNLPI